MSSNSWPKSPKQQIPWLQQRLSSWTNNADDLGLSAEAVDNLTNLLSTAATNMSEAAAARTAAKGKTTTFYASAQPLSSLAGAMIRTIRAYADTSGSADIYEIAGIDPKGQPTPVPAPSQPTNVQAFPQNDGSVLLTWRAKNAAPSAGTAFTIYRKLEGQEAFSPVGTVGLRKFTDETIPPGTPSAVYIIRGIRGEKVGPFSEPLTLFLGKAKFTDEDGLTLAA